MSDFELPMQSKLKNIVIDAVSLEISRTLNVELLTFFADALMFNI